MMDIEKMRPVEMHNQALSLRKSSGMEFYAKQKDNFVPVPCPVCTEQVEGQNIDFYKYGFSHIKCNSCNTLYVSPRPTEDQLFSYYANSEAIAFWTKLLIATNDERKLLQHIPRVNILKEKISAGQNKRELFVDLGAGNGNFSKVVQDANIFTKVLATDISDECIDACKSQGLATKKCTVDEFDDNSIDCIVFNDLIEHVFNPSAFLKSCYNKLRVGGVLMLSTPNGEGFDFKILKDKTENITPPEHLQYFNPMSIKILLEKLGFKTVNATTPGILDVEIIKRQINDKGLELEYDNSFLNFLFSLRDDDIENSFQSFLQINKLSSHMLIFTEKR